MSAISILVSNPLGPNLTRGKLLPLHDVPEVREINVVQDAAGPALSRVRYVPIGSPRWQATLPRTGRLVHLAHRIIAMATQVALRRPSLVMGFYMMPHGLIAYLVGKVSGCRVCIHVIGGPREIVDGGYWLDQWQVPWPSKRVEALYLWILRHTDIVIVVGTETKRYLARHGVPADRIHVISSKIDAARFCPSTAPRDYDLILAAQLIKRKRVDVFLRIVADLTRRHPHIRAAVLGDGPMRGDLERHARDLGIAHRVDFLGFHENTEAYYNRAKVFVLTSSAEGLSLAMLEAMACGLPAVVPGVGDLSDVVRDGETGYVVDAENHRAFVAAVERLLVHETRRHRLGETARATILRGYTVEDGARLWRAVLHSAAAPPHQTTLLDASPTLDTRELPRPDR